MTKISIDIEGWDELESHSKMKTAKVRKVRTKDFNTQAIQRDRDRRRAKQLKERIKANV